MQSLQITRPDDWHVHLRDDEMLERTVADISRYFGRAIVMPNLKPPVITKADAAAYKERITQAQPAASDFTPLMTLYLTDNTDPDDVLRACEDNVIQAIKYYPSGATTNSDAGVTDIRHCYSVLKVLEQVGKPLLIHGEVTDPDIDIFDREKVFIETTLAQILDDFADLKVVLEHITTADAVDFVSSGPDRLAATMTPQHLLLNRNHMLVGGIRPHYYCLPILKRRDHQQELLKAAISGNPKFFLGTDSAPHVKSTKETSCGCAGCYSAPIAIELYAHIFEQAGALDKLEAFASHFGADFYGLPRHQDSITLVRQPWQIPDQIACGGDSIVPLLAGETLNWQVA